MSKSLIIKITCLAVFSATSAHAQELLAPVVVSGSLVEQSIVDAPASISVMSGEELDKRPVHDVGDALKYVEGVTMTTGSNRGISLRGLGASYTLILINGKRVSSKLLSIRHNSDTDLSWISPSEIERIEVVRGPMATLYGADAMGGVINIITKKATDKWRTYVDGTHTFSEDGKQGVQNQINIGTSGTLIKDKLLAKVSLRHSEREKPRYEVSDARKFPGQKKLISANELTYIINPENQVKMIAEFTKDSQETISATGIKGDIRNSRSYLGAEHEMVTETLSWTTRAFQEAYKYEQSGEPSDLKATLIDSQTKFALGEKHFIVAGFEFQNYELDYVSRTGGTDPTQRVSFDEATTNSQYALFVEDAISLSQKSTLTLGVRNTKNTKFDDYLTPRAYLNQTINDNLTIKTGVGTGYKAPSLQQLAKDFRLPSCQGRCTAVGNPDLEPESNVSYEIGAYYKKDTWRANVTAFHTELKDMINSYRQGDFRLYRNIDRAKSRGIEFGSQFQLTKKIDMRLNYTVNFSEAANTGKRILEMPKESANLLFDYAINDKNSVYTALNYMGEVDREIDSKRVSTNPYATLDFGYNLRYKIDSIGNTRFTFGIENLTNHTLANNYGFGIMGRRYFVKAGIDF